MKEWPLGKNVLWMLFILALGFMLAGCAQQEHKITLEARPWVGGTFTGDGFYGDKGQVKVEAIPAADYVFLHWEEDGQIVSEDPVHTFEALSDTTLTAVFSQKIYLAPPAMVETLDRFWQGFITRDYYGLKEIVLGEALNQLDQGRFTKEVPGTRDFREQIEESFVYYARKNDQVLVKMIIQHPRVDPGYEEEIAEETARQLLNAAETGEELFFQNIYAEVMEKKYVATEQSSFHLLLEPDGEGWMVAGADDPRELLASFNNLYQHALCDQISDAVMEMHDDRGVLTFTFRGQSLTSKREFGNPLSPCLAGKTQIITSEGIALEAKDILAALRELEGTTIPFLDFAPEDFFHLTRFAYDPQREIVNLYLTRPYAILTMDCAVGFWDLQTEQAVLFEVVRGPGPDISDFYWAPNEGYVAYHWISSGRGGHHLHVYDIEKDRVIRFDDSSEAEAIPPEDRQFSDIRWSGDSKTLSFTITDQTDGTLSTFSIQSGDGS